MTFIFPRSMLSGLTLSTAGSSSTFNVADGQAADSTNAAIMNFAAMAKTTAAWAAGTGNGALDTGSIAASTWYHVHLIQTDDTTGVDILTSLSATAPTLPATYTLFRRIGSMKTDGSSQWTSVTQNGDEFLWNSPVADISGAAIAVAATLYTLTVPRGVVVNALGVIQIACSTPAYAVSFFAPGAVSSPFSVETNSAGGIAGCYFNVRTNTNAQIGGSANVAANGTTNLITTGWIDRRGKDV